MAYEWIVDALDQTWSAYDLTLRGRLDSDFDTATSCPGWCVRDVVNHVSGFELMLRGHAVPPHPGPWPDYVRNPIGEINEAFVASQRGRVGEEVMAQFRDATQRSLEHLRSLSEAQWEKIGWSPEGDRPYHRFQETRILDSWIHLHDVRDALDLVGDVHGPGEEIVVSRFEEALPYVVGKKCRAVDGTSVRVNLTGPLARSVLIGVSDGRARAVSASAVTPTLEVTTPVAVFWRRAAGRISATALLSAPETVVRGNEDVAAAFAEALAIMI